MGLVGSGRIVAVGEVMLELSGKPGGPHTLAWAGDTANTAVYLARLGLKPAYLTALGDDPYSGMIREGLADEGVDTALILRHPDLLPGLYAIQTGEAGERSFHYWRDNSAARALFACEGAEDAMDHAAGAGLLYLTGITLSIFSAEEQERLVRLARQVREAGGTVVFDPNYRPAGWASPEDARRAIGGIAPWLSVVLPTLDDENLLYGSSPADAHIERWHAAGAEEVVLKQGADGARVSSGGGRPVPVAAVTPEKIVDTTGAGDSFNAAYMAARLSGAPPEAAAAAGHRLSSRVIGSPGAIIPYACMPAIQAISRKRL